MYDIYFDENDMHQLVEESEAKEFWLMGDSFIFDSDDEVPDLETNDDYPIIVVRPKNGYHCTKCQELFPHSESNKKDGTFICYSCKNYG